MKETICNLLLFIQFFTRIPINLSLPCESKNFRRGSVFLPIVGLIIGGIQWGAYKLFIQILPLEPTVVIVLLIGVLLTGGLHIDGLGDTCDGFFAFKGSDRIIEIMKDSRIGTYSCIATIFDFLFKYTLIVAIAPKFSIAIIVAPMISRFTTVFLSAMGNTAKNTGTGNLFIGNIGKMQLVITVLITTGILILVMNPKYVIILLVSGIILSVVLNEFCKSKIGGITGDILGANNELVEILTLILIAIIMK
ncbi:adenosylcobinamide-GDP ribazoletransferase [Clostridium magnum]|uniref:Adenosylcobinamide-GDP ribazoletransferase n=1 Tax=Clostridium magnum DSM 2767 TaxID=1121326 RepID=A0A168DZH3_9CLOT|nr:adenosylcobinamide-GDP ribazoletransferase [Clostridium magnum]KZL93475.1 cobalamin synthase [Clostridium magnum DSM 2767]SHI27477.1 cobalamin-5'-phosphate synthase [Clostridium magnum DSM 2767]